MPRNVSPGRMALMRAPDRTMTTRPECQLRTKCAWASTLGLLSRHSQSFPRPPLLSHKMHAHAPERRQLQFQLIPEVDTGRRNACQRKLDLAAPSINSGQIIRKCLFFTHNSSLSCQLIWGGNLTYRKEGPVSESGPSFMSPRGSAVEREAAQMRAPRTGEARLR